MIPKNEKIIVSAVIIFITSVIIFPAVAQMPPTLNIPPTNAFDHVNGDNGTIYAVNFSMPLTIKGGTNVSIKANNSTHTLTISTTSGSSNSGSYNTTQANNVNINTGGAKLNFINGTNNPINIVNSPGKNQVNITISSSGSGGSGVTKVSGTTGQLAFWTGSNSIYPIPNLIWDNNTMTLLPIFDARTNLDPLLGNSTNEFTELHTQSVLVSTTTDTNILRPFTGPTGTMIFVGNIKPNDGTNKLNIGSSSFPVNTYVGTQVNSTAFYQGTDRVFSSINSQVGPSLLVQGTGNNITTTTATNTITINTGQNIANLASTQNQTFSGKVNFTATTKLTGINVGTLNGNPTNLRKGDLWYTTASNRFAGYFGSAAQLIDGNGGQTIGGTETFSGLIFSFIQNAADTTKKLVFSTSGMTTGHTQTWTVANANGTVLVSGLLKSNYTTPTNPATTTSTTGVMSNLFATFTPTVTGNISIEICGGMTSGTAGDGAGFDIRYGTSPITEGTAIGNTLVGKEQIITASTASKFQSACSIGYVSGLTLNTKYYFQIGKYAVTGGTATFQNFETYIKEV